MSASSISDQLRIKASKIRGQASWKLIDDYSGEHITLLEDVADEIEMLSSKIEDLEAAADLAEHSGGYGI